MDSITIRDWSHFNLAIEIILLIMVTVYSVIIANSLSSRIAHRYKNIYKCFLFDFSIVAIPIVLVTTVLSKYLAITHSVFLLLAVASMTLMKTASNANEPKNLWTSASHKMYISNCRSATYLITIICILAVDFPIFPLRYRKRAHYGMSLMDVGVGLFVCANGVVAPEITKYKSLTLKSTVLGTLPLIILGVGRYLATTAVQYNVEETEYGLHWNFFITLAVTRLLSALIMQMVAPNFINCLLIGIVIMGVHQWGLTEGLEEFVVRSEIRDTFIKANREGIISSLGFVGLYFLCVSLGFLLQSKFVTVGLATLVPILAVASVFLHQKFDVSRCLANSTYCTWVLFLYVTVTLMFNCYETFIVYVKGKNCTVLPLLFDAINYNGLAFFLVGNLTTGLVNLTIKTRKVQTAQAVLILIIYAFIVCLTITYLSMKKWRIKL